MRAVDVVQLCPAAQRAPAVAAAWRRRRTAAYGPDVEYLFAAAGPDIELLDAGLALASDPGASVPTRALSWRALEGMFFEPRAPRPIDEYTGAGVGNGCRLVHAVPAAVLTGAARGTLPADYAARIRRAAELVEQDAAQPREVRSAANCVRNTWRAAAGFAPAPLAALNLSTVRLTYLCGRRFRVRNPNPAGLELRYDVYGSGEAGALFAPARPADAAHSEVVFSTASAGTVRVFYEDRLIQTKANGGTSCQP